MKKAKNQFAGPLAQGVLELAKQPGERDLQRRLLESNVCKLIIRVIRIMIIILIILIMIITTIALTIIITIPITITE